MGLKKNRQEDSDALEIDCPECNGDAIVEIYEDEQKMFSSEFSMSRCRTCSGQGSVFLAQESAPKNVPPMSVAAIVIPQCITCRIIPM
jgi:DnaJ-class molecular chaperone